MFKYIIFNKIRLKIIFNIKKNNYYIAWMLETQLAILLILKENTKFYQLEVQKFCDFGNTLETLCIFYYNKYIIVNIC